MLAVLDNDFKLNHKELFEYRKHSKIITFNKKHYILDNLINNSNKTEYCFIPIEAKRHTEQVCGGIFYELFFK